MKTHNPTNSNLQTRTESSDRTKMQTLQEALPLICDGGFPIAVICAWCGNDMPIRAFGEVPGMISHGMCEACRSTLEDESAAIPCRNRRPETLTQPSG